MAKLTQQELQQAIDDLMVANNTQDVTVTLQKALLKDQMESVSGQSAVDKEVFEASDLDAFIVGDAWEFTSPINLIMKGSFSTDKAIKNVGTTVDLIQTGLAGDGITYTGTGACLRGFGDLLAVDNVGITLTGNGASLFDLDGVGFVSINGDQVRFQGSNQSVGTVKNASLAYSSELVQFIGYANGLVMEGVAGMQMDAISWISDQVTPGVSLSIDKHSSIINLEDMTYVLGAGQECLKLDPDLRGKASLHDFTDVNNAVMYHVGDQGAISAFADAAIGATAVASVTDNSGVAVFNHAGTDVFVGQDVALSGFVTNTGYNGTFEVTAVGAGTFEVGVAFGSNEAGSFLSDSVTVTATAHGLSELQTILVEDGADYYGGATIYNVLTNSFQINRTFTVDKTGNWNTGSLTEDDARVTSEEVGNEADSRSAAVIQWNGNGATTAVTDGAYTDLNLTNILDLDEHLSRFFVEDFVTGELIYKGLKPLRGIASLVIASSNSGVPNADYRFTFQHNDDVPVFATAPYMPMSLKAEGDQITMVFPLKLNPGDRFRVKIAGDGTGTDLAVAHGTITFS